jgi:hypothetical protein
VAFCSVSKHEDSAASNGVVSFSTSRSFLLALKDCSNSFLPCERHEEEEEDIRKTEDDLIGSWSEDTRFGSASFKSKTKSVKQFDLFSFFHILYPLFFFLLAFFSFFFSYRELPFFPSCH